MTIIEDWRALSTPAKVALVDALTSLPDDRSKPVPVCQRIVQLLDAVGPLTRRKDLPEVDRVILHAMLSNERLLLFCKVLVCAIDALNTTEPPPLPLEELQQLIYGDSMNQTDITNAIYAGASQVCEHREFNGDKNWIGNGHHMAQNIVKRVEDELELHPTDSQELSEQRAHLLLAVRLAVQKECKARKQETTGIVVSEEIVKAVQIELDRRNLFR